MYWIDGELPAATIVWDICGRVAVDVVLFAVPESQGYLTLDKRDRKQYLKSAKHREDGKLSCWTPCSSMSVSSLTEN